MTDNLALAERVEAASGPDRELDCRIAAAAHQSMAGEFHVVGAPTYEPERYFSRQEGIDWIGYDLLNNAPAYTASLDAAMTLVPKGLTWDLSTDFVPCHAGIYNGRDDDEGLPAFSGDAATPALALCAAALRSHGGEG